MSELTQSRLKELFTYDLGSGNFIRNIAVGKAKVGDIAGNVSTSTGYVYIKIDYKLYAAHDLAFLYVEGRYPTCKVDHEDTDRINNSWKNLRECTTSQNGFNAKTRVDNLLGIKGLNYTTGRSPQYTARITDRGKVYRRTFAVRKHGKDNAKKLALEWLHNKRNELHGEFANHG